MHNYDVTGYPKVKVISTIMIVSISVSTWLNLSMDYLKENFGMPLSFTFSFTAVFTILYLLFSKYLWKIDFFIKLLQYPNLNGEYSIVGKSIKKTTGETFDWEGVLQIIQDWDKILISMKSKNSSSESISVNGSITHYPRKGYELKYSYSNTPNNSMVELHKHEGTCTLSFDEDIQTATGNYYNDMKNRENFGSMELRRTNE